MGLPQVAGRARDCSRDGRCHGTAEAAASAATGTAVDQRRPQPGGRRRRPANRASESAPPAARGPEQRSSRRTPFTPRQPRPVWPPRGPGTRPLGGRSGEAGARLHRGRVPGLPAPLVEAGWERSWRERCRCRRQPSGHGQVRPVHQARAGPPSQPEQGLRVSPGPSRGRNLPCRTVHGQAPTAGALPAGSGFAGGRGLGP